MNKSKILKIFTIFIAILLIILTTVGITLADTQTINGKNFTTNGGSYHDAFQNKGSDLFDITWNDVKNKYYTSGSSTNDYQDYIVGSKDGYCLNENTADGNQNFYIAAIVDIDGGNVKVYSRKNPSGASVYVGDSASEFAEAVYYKYNYPAGHNIVSTSQNAYYAQAWVNNWGWIQLYSKIGSLIGDSSVAPTHSKNNYYSNNIEAPNYDLSSLEIKKDGNLMIENGSYTVSGKIYKTKMGKYTIGYNNNLNYSIEITTENGSQYKGIYNKGDGYIYAEDEITDKIKSIKISQSYEGYKARLIVIGTGASQARMIAYGEKNTISKTDSTTDLPEQSVDISLQKYITKVISGDNTVTYDNQTERKNKYADEDDNFVTDKTALAHQGVEISNKNDEKLDNEDKEYKSANPVKIEVGDTVEYTIKVYNNSDHSAKVTAKDVIDNRAEMLSDYKNEKDNIYFLCENEEFAANETKTFTVQLKYSEYTADKIMNKAWIANTNPSNKKEHRTVDADYIEMLKYSVALEKFVSKVNNEPFSDEYEEKYDIDSDGVIGVTDINLILKHAVGDIELSDSQKEKADVNGDGNINSADAQIILPIIERELKAIWDEEDKDYKTNNPVRVELGDEVTYTIKLTNTGETVIKVTEIEDVFDENDNADIEYIENSIAGYGKPSVKSENGKLTITIEDPDEIPAVESKYLTLRFKVKAKNAEATKNEQVLKNTATVTKITNKNNILVSDSDGVKNNTDSDWIKTKIYAVSLEKFISSVDGKEPTGDDADREGKPEYLTSEGTYKKNHIVTVSKGEIVAYTIKVTNDGETSVYVSEITDSFPEGVKYKEGESTVKFTNLSENLLQPGESASFIVEVEVTAENTSMEVLKNTAEITKIEEKRKEQDILDSTPNDNKDSDYIDLNFEEPPPVIEKTSYSVEKVWSDDNDKYQKRPESVKVVLYRIEEEEKIQIEEVELNSGNNWKYEWPELEKCNESGNEHQYSVEERAVDNYKTTYTKTNNKTIIKNTYYEGDKPGPEYIDIKVQKYWKNDTSSKRPTSIKVQLYKNGNKEGSEVELNVGNGWSHVWEGKDKEYTYDVKEVNVPEGYTVEYSGDYNGYSIFNTYKPNIPDVPITPDDPIPDYSVISGYVWNDISEEKINSYYDGIYNTAVEKAIPDITVSLHRIGVGVIATTKTDKNGYYSFNDLSLATNMTLVNELAGKDGRYLKGPKHCYRDPDTGALVTTTWTGEYYSYYVEFEYDGVTYTSTKYEKLNTPDAYNSNAQEKETTRIAFNTAFEAYRDSGLINYETTNETGYIPQSIHNSTILGQLLTIYTMKSSTENFNMKDYASDTDLKKLTHINLGLRGRDIFDLELTSEVEEINVKVNTETGVYKNTNRVNLRKSEIIPYEDMANVEKEEIDSYLNTQNQYIRETDKNNLNEVKVIYKITVYNASVTPGTATKITNYYDNDYTFKGAYNTLEDAKNNNNALEIVNSKDPSGGYGYKTIETNWGEMTQSQSKAIYVVYTLNNTSISSELATYNMSEISAYTTGGDNHFTRGLIDKDSAPGSANKEQVRTTDTEGQNTSTSIGNPTTVEYYFGGNDLSKLKYEDDTYATPVIYTIEDSKRTIEGYVFEDLTTVDPTTRIKTGNGKLDEENEVGVYGAIVKLIDASGNAVSTETRGEEAERGKFVFEGVLPGKYTIEYIYGSDKNTVLLGQFNEDTNKESYNGEDYQSTNNTGAVKGIADERLYKLDDTTDFWYVYNEAIGISTATDDSGRRDEISTNVSLFPVTSDDKTKADMEKLNNIRELIGTYSEANNGTLTANKKWDKYKNNKLNCNEIKITGIQDIINKTEMKASTKQMTVTVEETIDLNNTENIDELLNNNLVRETKSGLGEWCIFPGTNENGYYPEYKIEKMNFGLAKVPVTVVDLQKYISGFTITDSTGNNIIASLVKSADENGDVVNEFGKWDVKGDTIYLPTNDIGTSNPYYDVSIEDEKLQGARLEVTYTISQVTTKEEDFKVGDGKAAVGTIKGIVDLVDNNLSYNPELGDNNIYWEVISSEKLKEDIKNLGTIYQDLIKDAEIKEFEGSNNTILKLKDDSGFYNVGEGSKDVTVTLEKVLSSTNSTIDQILSDVLDDSGYSNTIRITDWEYSSTDENPKVEGIDRIRTPEGYIILPGIQNDYETSEILVIQPPTGDSNISIIYLLIVIASLAVLSAGVFGIKKFVIKK